MINTTHRNFFLVAIACAKRLEIQVDFGKTFSSGSKCKAGNLGFWVCGLSKSYRILQMCSQMMPLRAQAMAGDPFSV
ncbi:hypothetical protein AO940_25735 [Pseudomonas aeruginosa]|nr:hypothetical protein AO940_25735 [Pseudomonas aeruginosa]